MKFVVTNVRVEASLLRRIKSRALERGVPASVIIREALKQYLATPQVSREHWEREKQSLLKFCGIGRSGRGTGSTDIDEVLYGPRGRR